MSWLIEPVNHIAIAHKSAGLGDMHAIRQRLAIHSMRGWSNIGESHCDGPVVFTLEFLKCGIVVVNDLIFRDGCLTIVDAAVDGGVATKDGLGWTMTAESRGIRCRWWWIGYGGVGRASEAAGDDTEGEEGDEVFHRVRNTTLQRKDRFRQV